MRARILGCLLFVIPWNASAGDPAPGSGIERFEKKVRPLLADRCWQCHGPEKQRGGLRLDSAEGIAEGGDSGPVLVAGKPDESLLIKAVRYHDELKMPPKGKLPDADVAELADWVKSGAEWPGLAKPKPPAPSTTPAAEPSAPFWAFQPVRDPAPPEVKSPEWAKSPIDRFLFSTMQKKGLSPAPPAEKRALIRRATFDLIGLPPTPEEIDAFLADSSPEAFAKVIDRLLASPRYGERWGRQWLDLARYSDSNGMDENVAYANAFRYRDYVIKSFNDDTPYDRFLTEQIAGDLMPPSDIVAVNQERLVATGFLVLGPKMLAEDDPMKMEMDIIDEQVDTVSRVFMGLTMGCARCHDHKFDPLPTTDYYALAGIFKSTRSMQNHRVVAMWNERPLATKEEIAALDAHTKDVAKRKAVINVQNRQARAAIKEDNRKRAGEYLAAGLRWDEGRSLRKSLLEGKVDEKTPGAIVREAESFDRGNVLIDTTHYGPGIGVILNKGEVPNFVEYDVTIESEGLYRIEVRHTAAEPRPVRMMVDGSLVSAEVAKDVTGSWTPEKQDWFAAGLVTLSKGRQTIRMDRDGPFPHLDKLALVPRTLPQGVDPSTLASLDSLATKRSLNPRLIERWADALAGVRADKASWLNTFHKSLPGVKDDPTPEELGKEVQDALDHAAKADVITLLSRPTVVALHRALSSKKGPLVLPREVEPLLPPKTAEELRKSRESLAEFEKSKPPVSEAMSVQDQKATDLKVHIRGNHMTLGDVVPRRFPKVLSASQSTKIDSTRSGRLDLANWLTRPDHPLTARVMVNRIWLGHFGEGLVRSPDNFGRLGETPDHPELLDWLASRFIESGWSIKAMHRRIMLSSAYQMSTRYDANAALVDPENRLLWHMPRHRLDVESIRDAILMVSGELDPTMGGSLLPTKNHAYVNDTGARGATRYDSNRRSVYLPVIRSGLYDVFQAFDFADPSASNGKRVPTTVAPQALFMMNDKLVLRASEAMAKDLLALPGLDDAGRIRKAYLAAYGRPATDKEIERASSYLRRFDAELEAQKVAADVRPARAWQALCQTIFAGSEFIYLD